MIDTDNIHALVNVIRAGQKQAEIAVNLVPSENRLSPLAMLPLDTDYYNRYFFNQTFDPGFWQFRGGQDVAQVEIEAMTSLSQLARAPHVNARPISGMSAMMMAMAGLGGKPGGTVVSVDVASGGHYATADMARRLGFEALTVPAERGRVDEQRLGQVLHEHEPELVYLDLQNSRHELDVRQVADLIGANSPRTLLHVDCSHTMGLVLGGALRNPLDEGADTSGGSTHKSFPGPHKGFLFTRSPQLHERLIEAQMTMLSSHHFAETLALGIAAFEFCHFGHTYAEQVVRNARLLSELLFADGFQVTVDEDGHGTDTHQVWVKIGDAEETDRLSKALYDHRIRVNVQVDLPGVPGPVFRLGVGELTFLGARESAVQALAEEFGNARAGVRRDGRGSRRVREQCGEPFYFTEAW
ncbi:hypothetical protein [Amycolatopsis cihanbeyliensis]|uniref:Glycine hydroxymethyltransferase n=1 Tax=Amycolatopsis cihanbeyliensis TaxID=1128664 RepID=A0A542DEW6_AMYCI|nr:hypothetical protein [Amycolatopsis cihanbeyliensis]TQJ01628.1 glycine hydroxymethyltransferase [Amycolatopsis cihanbeyliensis]